MNRTRKLAVLEALLLALCVARCCGQAQCPNGQERSKPGGPCDRCLDYFEGKPPNCKPCKFYWGSTVRQKDGSNVCECGQGFSGVYPKCKACPPGTETEKAGNGQTCSCTQPKDTPNAVRVSCGTCNTKNGWYERALYTNTSSTSFKYPPGKVCLFCKVSDQQQGLVVKGGKCACDTAKKYGFSLEYQGFTSVINICQKCDGSANTTLAKDGRCLCKKGFGVVPVWGFNYCAKCENGKVDKNGFCICNKGYAWSYDTSKCIECSGPRFEQRKNNKCYCGKGYEGFANNIDGKVSGCDKCPTSDFTTVVTANEYNACVCKDKRKGRYYNSELDFRPAGCKCRWGFEPKGASCAYDAFCASKQYKIEYWVDDKLPKGFDGKTFPASLASTAPSAFINVAAADWKAGAWPLLPPAPKTGGKFAARVTRCVCLKHADWSTQFKYAVVKDAKGYAKLVIDGGQTERGTKGDFYDENINGRPGVRPVLPVQSQAAAGKAATLRAIAPQYNPTMGGFLSGMDSIPNIQNYEACHKVEVFYASANGAGDLKILLPTKPVA